jgi:glycosyltransferase involved in cell wall biosynthesis
MDGITPIVNIRSGCDYHRVILPLKYLNVHLDDFENRNVLDVLSKTKVLLFNRNPQADINTLLNLRKRFGYKIVCDIDDYWDLYNNHHLNAEWVKQHIPQKIVYCLSVADAVFTTTPLLADKVKEINKNVHVIPNALPFGYEQFTDTKIDSDLFRVIYAGGASHFWDLMEIKHAFKRLNAEKVPNIEYILAGHSGNDSSEWGRIEGLFTLNHQLINYRRKLALGLEEYMNQYSDADLSLAPLQNKYFNTFKSNLKIIEAGCKNIPIITSNISPYADEKDLSKITLARNTKEWYEAIKKYAKNPQMARDNGQKLAEYVRSKYNLLKINELRRQIFERLSE